MLKKRLQKARKRIAQYIGRDTSLVDELIAERQEEIRRENEKSRKQPEISNKPRES
jgi:hypothetical protein